MNPPDERTEEVLIARDVLANPATSYWLRSAIEGALARDPVDALNDALVLAAVLDGHLREVLELDSST